MMDNFRRFALFSTVATYFLVFVGGLVRVAGAGLGCPDWPKCFGRWVPPFSIDQVPPNVDASSFNVVLAWIEYSNRLAGMTVGLLILATAILALKHYRRSPKILYPSLAAAVLVAFEGWQGSVVVASELQPLIVSVHMILALVIICLLLYATLESHRSPAESQPDEASQPIRSARVAVAALGVATMIQVALGTQVRQALEVAVERFPLSSELEWLAAAGRIVDIHMGLGLLLVGLGIYVTSSVLRQMKSSIKLVSVPAKAIMALIGIQAALGLLLRVFELSALAKLFHLWLGALLISLLMVLYNVIRRPLDFQSTWKRSAYRLTGMTAGLVVAVTVAAILILGKAERSHETIPLIGSFSSINEIDLTGRISIIGFVGEEASGIIDEMHEWYKLYEHSDAIRIVSIHSVAYSDSTDISPDMILPGDIDRERWLFVGLDSLATNPSIGIIRSMGIGFSNGTSDQFLLIDTSGQVRGIYDRTSSGAIRKMKQDIKTLSKALP